MATLFFEPFFVISGIPENFGALQFGAAHGPAMNLWNLQKEFWRFRLTFEKGLLN
ncbi:MAG: hypothetical protein ACM3U2_14485 [Deltaproteobacteria bacterium]